MSTRDVAREDLTEEQVLVHGLGTVFMVARIRCCRCLAEFRVVTKPYPHQNEAAREVVTLINDEGWKTHGNAAVCPVCRPAASG
jgi:hypothetical protein